MTHYFMTKTESIRVLALLAALVFLPVLAGCPLKVANAPKIKDGKSYGVTSGAFRGRWWSFYERGASFSDGQFWAEAESDLRTALRLRSKDQRRARTYGMHFIDYFPHRELGVVLYHQGRYEEALRELGESLASEKSAKAEFYTDCTRKALIRDRASDSTPPEISAVSPEDELLTNGLTVRVSGRARDDTFVKTLQINGVPVRIDMAEREVPFEMAVPLKPGENLISIVAVDLAGKTTVVERRVQVDRQGPLLAIEKPSADVGRSEGPLRLKGYVSDDSGVVEVKVDGKPILDGLAMEAQIDYLISRHPGDKELIIEARDRVGNTTTAHIGPSEPGITGRRIHLASLDLPLLAVQEGGQAGADSSPPAIELRNWTAEQTVFLDQVYLEGCARDECPIEELTINGRPVLKKPGQLVYFNNIVGLEEGVNELTIEARDARGNGAEKKIRIEKKAQKVRDLGSRLTAALLPFERKGMQTIGAEGVEDLLLSGLVDQRRFEMVERMRLEEILREQKLGRSELADQSTAIRVGKIAAVQCVLMGTTVEKEGSIELYVRLVDTETSLIVATADVYSEDMDPQKLRDLCNGLRLKLADELPVAEGLVVQVKGKRLVLDLGKQSRIRKGMRLLVFREGEPILHPVTGAVLGSDVEMLSHAMVQSVRDMMSEAEILDDSGSEKIEPMQKVITQ